MSGEQWGSVGHYAIGSRDGGSEWHIGTRNRRDCGECAAFTAALARAERKRLAEEVRRRWPHSIRDDGRILIDRAAVLRLIEDTK